MSQKPDDPFAKYVKQPDPFASYVKPVGTEALTPSHAPKPPSTLSAAFDFITNLMESGGMGDSYSTKGLGGALKSVKRELTDPNNLSVAGGAAGGLAGGLALGPAGAVGGATLGGTLASKFGEGRDWGSAMKEGAGEGAIEGIGGPIAGAAGKYVFAPLARGAVGAALKPSRSVLDALLDPTTGRQFNTPGEAGRFFRGRATDLMDQVPGTPGRSTYANGLIDMDVNNRALKVDALKRTPDTLTDDELIPPGSFDSLIQRLTERRGDALQHTPEIDNAVKQALSVSHAQPTRQGLPGARPMVSAPSRGNEWTLEAADRRQGGLQDELDNLFARKQRAEMMGDSAKTETGEEATKVIRSTFADAIANKAVPASDGRTVAQLNAALRENIPFKQAAVDATMPIWGDAMPRMRIAGSPTSPNVQVFDYLRKAIGAVARPSHQVGKALQRGTTQQLSPQMLRLLEVLGTGK